MTAQEPTTHDRLIGGLFSIDPSRPLADGGAGLAAFAADRRGGGAKVMAIQSLPDAPPRVHAIAALGGLVIPGLLAPLAAGPARAANGHDALFVICPAPPGPSLAGLLGRPWDEQELLHGLLRPVASVLAALHALPLTHRAIRLDNLFRGGAGEPVVVGCGWAAPAGLLQPALYEPPYSGMCLPAGRGEGSVADDVYALGVVMLVLALGRVPLADLDETDIVRRKLELGSFKALVGQARLSPIIADLVSGMLAEDPEHRPPPSLLADPVAARARRVAARPPRRAQRALDVGGREVWHARTLAHALASEADGGARLLRSGAVDGWLRRSLGEAPLATRIEEAVRQRQADAPGEDTRADAVLAMRAVVALDSLAPLAWEGIAFWPDGIAALLAQQAPAGLDPVGGAGATGGAPDRAKGAAGGRPDVAAKLGRLIMAEAALIWAASRVDRCDIATLRLDMRQHRARMRLAGWGGGMARLRFSLNPLLTCRSPLLDGTFVLRLADLLHGLETAAIPENFGRLPIDREIAAFVAARDDQRPETALAALGSGPAEAQALASLHLLASLQRRLGVRPLPKLSTWFAHHLGAAATTWRNRGRRERSAAALAGVIAGGRLDDLLAMVDDPVARAEDAAGAAAAEEAVRQIDRALAGLAAGAASRADSARRIGCEVTTGAGLAAVSAMSIVAMAG